jgi:hypothetical protein
MIQEDLMLEEYKVRRRRMAQVHDMDPFIVQDPQDNEVVHLERYEIDALERAQLLSYIKARKEIELIESSDEVTLIIPILFASLFATLLIVIALNPVLVINPLFIAVLVLLPVLATSSGYFAYGRAKSSMFFNNELLAAIIKENPTFLDSLRLLADKSTAKDWKKKEYRREVQYYENMLSRLDSE